HGRGEGAAQPRGPPGDAGPPAAPAGGGRGLPPGAGRGRAGGVAGAGPDRLQRSPRRAAARPQRREPRPVGDRRRSVHA
ncbi:MAG: hypothetical protein ACK559_24555, partial [bacterium]